MGLVLEGKQPTKAKHKNVFHRKYRYNIRKYCIIMLGVVEAMANYKQAVTMATTELQSTDKQQTIRADWPTDSYENTRLEHSSQQSTTHTTSQSTTKCMRRACSFAYDDDLQ